jgi:hypothetical protein
MTEDSHSVAVHEAAHAVAALVLGFEVDKVTWSESCAGCRCTLAGSERIVAWTDARLIDRAVFELVAGCSTPSEADVVHEGSIADRAEAERCLGLVRGDRVAARRRTWERATRLALDSAFRDAVEEVAAALVERKTLLGLDLRELVSDAEIAELRAVHGNR